MAVGITDHGQALMRDLVFVEAPAVGLRVGAGQACGALESVKAAADLHAPIAGQVIEVNPAVSIAPESLNANPWTTWVFRLKPDCQEDVAGLLTAQAYAPLSD